MSIKSGTLQDGHVALDLECFDRIYLNGWVHNLQVSGQVVNFLTHHLGFPIPSPAILEKIGLRFRKAVAEFAAANDIEVVRFAKGERKLDVMRPHLDRLAREGRCGVAARLAYSWPLIQILHGYGKYAHTFTNAGPNTSSTT